MLGFAASHGLGGMSSEKAHWSCGNFRNSHFNYIKIFTGHSNFLEQKGEYVLGPGARETVEFFILEVEDLWIHSRDEVTDVGESDFNRSVVLCAAHYLVEELRTGD